MHRSDERASDSIHILEGLCKTVHVRTVTASLSSRPPTRVRYFGALESLPNCYDVLFGRSDQNFFLSRPWFENFVATTGSETEELAIMGIEADEAEPVALAAFIGKRHKALHGPLRLKALSSLSNFYTMEFAPLLAEEDGGLLEDLARGIATTPPVPDVVGIGPVDPSARVTSLLIPALQNAGFVVRQSFRFGNWYERVEGRSFDEYLKDRPSILRNTLRRRRQGLTKSHRARFEIVSDESRLAVGSAAYESVYRSSWKGEELYPAFIPGLLRTAAAAGCLRLGLLYVDDIAAAAQIWITSGRTATIYKLAYDERFKSLSVGSLLTEHMMRHSIDVDRVEEIDFGSGDDSYKKDWMSARREKWDLTGFNRATPLGLLAAASWRGKVAAQAAAMRIRGLRPAVARAS